MYKKQKVSFQYFKSRRERQREGGGGEGRAGRQTERGRQGETELERHLYGRKKKGGGGIWDKGKYMKLLDFLEMSH